ncbi:MAG: ATP-dependent zinc metalloprotease FtsH [Polyangiaceae bacterium]|nr:ATP-dependent zinc metalloprotease FtsH [Polyangiaceae bacterium]
MRSPPSFRPSSGSSGGAQTPNTPSWKGWVILAVLLAGFAVLRNTALQEDEYPEVSYSQFYGLLEKHKVHSAVLKGQKLIGRLNSDQSVDGKTIHRFRTMVPEQGDQDLIPLMRKQGVDLTVSSEEQPLLVQLLMAVLPWALIIGLWVWISRRAQRMMGPGGALGGVLKGRTRRFEKESEVAVRFDDVAGLGAAKKDLTEIVEFLKEPARFRRLGGKVPRGVLLVGPPGTGKTLLARAVAGESGVPFFSINGSEFIELFVGVGASRVRELFEEAKKVAPAIVFIDEIDAVGRSRGAGLGGGHDEREQTLNQLLSEMDGFSRNDLTIVLAATNRPDVLDAALLRPGRFDRRVVIDRPELPARQAILEVHTKEIPLGTDVGLRRIAGNTPGFSGADLANLVNEAALNATRRGADAVESQDFTAAYDKIVLGDPRETKLDPMEKNRVAIHEAGHAIASHFTPDAEPLQRVTILPRGMALGVTQFTPAGDRHIMTKAELEAKLQVLLGGYAAERLVFGDTASGAENDLQRATEIAFKMVAHFGMSDALGPVFHEHKTEHPFLGQRLAVEGATSDATVHAIEQETRVILTEAAAAAGRTLERHRAELDRLVEALMAEETIEQEALDKLLGPRPAGGRRASLLPPAQPGIN